MNAKSLIKTLLPGLLPLFVFIAADEIWGTEIGLYVAVSVGIVQIVAIYIKEKRLDKFVFFDTILIVGLGLVSILLHNDIFFKIKPAVIGIILVAILGLSTFSSKNIMLMMSQRYLKGVKISEEQQKHMNRSIRLMFWLFLAHTILVFYSAFYMSKEAWAFISGVLFYLIFGAYFVVEIIKNLIKKRKYANEEWLFEVDEDGKIIGKITRTQAHDGSLKLHPVIHVHIFNNKGNLLLQKRNINKKIQPGKWDTSVGGHISYGEKIEDALERETYEEIGLKNIKFQFLTKYVWQSEIERELVFVFGAKCNDIDFKPNEEVDQVKFWNKKELELNLKKGVFTPNFEVEYEKLLKQIIK